MIEITSDLNDISQRMISVVAYSTVDSKRILREKSKKKSIKIEKMFINIFKIVLTIITVNIF